MRSTRLLVVEDDPELCELLAELFSDAGYETERAENGAVALEKIASFQPDLVVSDIRMPVCDGFELVRRIPGDPLHPRVLFISAYADFGSVDITQTPRVIGFLRKPIDGATILAKLKDYAPVR